MSLATTGRLELREFAAADFEDVHRYAADPEVTRFMSWGPNDAAETRAFLERAEAGSACSASPREIGVPSDAPRAHLRGPDPGVDHDDPARIRPQPTRSGAGRRGASRGCRRNRHCS